MSTVLFQTIQFSISTVFCLHTVKCKKQIIQFSTVLYCTVSTQFTSILPRERTLSSATTLGQSGPGSDVNEVVFWIP